MELRKTMLGRVRWLFQIWLLCRTEGVEMSGNARRLENDYRELREAFDGDPRVKVIPLGTAPFEKYRIAYIGVPSLRQNQGGQPMLVDQTVVDIELPAGQR